MLFAQEFLVGSVVTADGTELTGYVQFRSTDSNPKRFRFREKPRGPVTVYEMGDLISVEAGGNRFEFAVVDIEVSVEREPMRKYEPLPFFEKDSVYLRVLIAGSRMLYHYKAPGGRDYFYTRNLNGKLELLVQKFWEQRSPDWVYLRKAENTEYKTQLKEYLQPYQVTDEALVRLRYTKNELVSLVKEYYRFRNETPQTAAQDEKARVYLGLTGGNVQSTLMVKSPRSLNYLDDVPYNTSNKSAVGIFGDFVLAETRERVSFYAEVAYNRYQFGGTTTVTVRPQEVYIYTPDVDLEYLKFTPMMRYRWNSFKLQPFFNAGFSMGHLFRYSLYVNERRLLYGIERDRRYRILNDPEPRPYSNGIVVGGGFVFGGLSIETRYERFGNFSGYGSINAKPTNLHVLGSYRFAL